MRRQKAEDRRQNETACWGSAFGVDPISSRPPHLLARPVEIGVIVSPSHERDGRPVAFTWEREHYTVAHWIGPERIAGLWWTGHDKTRDYFEVEVAEGMRFWMFRVAETGKWYLHGVYG